MTSVSLHYANTRLRYKEMHIPAEASTNLLLLGVIRQSMGIIEKQSIRGTIYAYLGVAVGFITAGVIQPLFLSPEQNGVLDLLMTWSLVFATLATLGINNVTNRLFPWFRDPQNRHHHYFGLVFWVTLAGFLVSTAIFLLIKPGLISSAEEKSVLFIPYIDYIIPLTAFTAIYLVADIYYSALYKSAMGIFIREFLMRIFILLALLLFIFNITGFSGTVIAYVVALSLPGLIITLLLIRDGEFRPGLELSHIKPTLARSMLSVAGFGIIMTFSNIVVQYIDRIMIDHYLGLGAVGIYGRAFIYGTLVSIASRAVNKISGIVIAQAWKERRLADIRKIYANSTLHQLLFGLLIFSGILANLENIRRLLPEAYGTGIQVVLFIGLANLFHMASGVSVAIMSTSRHYRLLALFIVIFVLLIILSNMILIPLWGITGAAVASALSVFAYSTMRYLFLKLKYGMEPYSWRHLAMLAFAAAACFAGWLVPDLYDSQTHYLTLAADVAVRGSVVVITFTGLTLITGISPDLSTRVMNLLRQRRSKTGEGEK